MEDLSIQPQDQSISVLEKVVVGKDNNYYYWYKAPQFRLMIYWYNAPQLRLKIYWYKAPQFRLMIYWYKAPQLRLMIYWYNAPQLRQKHKILFSSEKLLIQKK